MDRYKITISYDGTRFAGWQVQATSIAIQPLIQKAIETILRHPIQLAGAGRTDAGVHAKGQVAHFDTEEIFEPHPFLVSLNALLPKEISVNKIEKVPNDFHARYSAISKVYHYHLHFDPVIDPFSHLYRNHVLEKLDLDLMTQAKERFLGTHDFTSFTNKPQKSCAKYDSIRTLSRLDIVLQQGGVRLEFEGNGFLYKMVRNITGTLIDIAANRISISSISKMFQAKDRKTAGNTAPPQGLFLMEVKYSQESRNNTSLQEIL